MYSYQIFDIDTNVTRYKDAISVYPTIEVKQVPQEYAMTHYAKESDMIRVRNRTELKNEVIEMLTNKLSADITSSLVLKEENRHGRQVFTLSGTFITHDEKLISDARVSAYKESVEAAAELIRELEKEKLILVERNTKLESILSHGSFWSKLRLLFLGGDPK